MTDEQKGDLLALSELRSRHRWQIGKTIGAVRAMQAHEKAIASLDLLIAKKKKHAAEDAARRQQSRPSIRHHGE